MILTAREEEVLKGEHGEAEKIALEVLVKLGDLYGAERFIRISSSHSVSYIYNCGYDALVEIVEKLAKLKAKVKVPTSLCTGSATSNYKDFGIPKEWFEKHLKLERAAVKINAQPLWTCIPYVHDNVPKFGQNVAWSESNCVSFANSVIGARTNRYTGFVDIFAAIAGKVPKYGLHLPKNRLGNILFEVTLKSREITNAAYSLMGYYVGKMAENMVPVIKGLPKNTTRTQLKYLGAAAASSGAVALYHAVGITPEAKTLEEAFGGNPPEDKIQIGAEELRQTIDELNTGKGGEVDLVVVGCPQYTFEELKRLVELVRGNRINRNVEFWVITDGAVRNLAEKMGCTEILRKAGVKLMTSTCLLNGPFYGRFKNIVTDSAKIAHYAPMQVGAGATFTETERCVEAAVRGEIA